jgi:hypothetical protein
VCVIRGPGAPRRRLASGLELGDWQTADARFTAMGRKLFFVTTRGENSHQLWEVDPDAGGIAGTVFDDVDADGVRDAGEGPLRGYKVFLDRNNDGVCNKNETWTRASSSGRYQFDFLPAGKYTVRIVGVERRRASTPERVRVSVTPGATTIRYFGRTEKVLLGGTVYIDANQNGVIEGGESGAAAGWTAFVDVNTNGVRDDDELTTVTDELGRFLFSTLDAGTHRVRVVPRAGYQTSPPGASYRKITLAAGGVYTKASFGQAPIT